VAPREAVRDADGKTVVFLFRDGRLERRAVSLGTVRGTDVEVTAGLSPGDQVVVKGPEGLHDGQRVKLK
jgi:multidrug efflux pump subunit AcrA (membrane-fusion protein)